MGRDWMEKAAQTREKKGQQETESPASELMQFASRIGNQAMLELLGQSEPKKANRTGLPDSLKEQFERSSGLSFEDVRVHYHSDKPAKLGAYAYTQGTQVYLGTGQEQHLPHELTHVVQQKQGMVSAREVVKGLPINEDHALEYDAERVSFGRAEEREKANAVSPIQMCRYPTFYTYLMTPSRNKLSDSRQGPHTIPHTYYDFLMDRYGLKELFDNMVPDPGKMDEILGREEITFDQGWTEEQLQHQRITNGNRPWNGAELSELVKTRGKDFGVQMERFRNDYAAFYANFQEEENPEDLGRLLDMHPYSTYAWRGSKPRPEELSGKGESSLNTVLQGSLEEFSEQFAYASPDQWKKYLDFGEDGRHTFRDIDGVRSFLTNRLWCGVETEEDLEKLVDDVTKRLL